MNIKETENEVGIRRANIRYYEEQGLIIPKRNPVNNYRDYSEEDVMVLKKIKTLRLLGISVAEIKELQEEKTALNKILAMRIAQIEGEIAGLKETKELCNVFQEHCLTYENLDLSLVNIWESLSLQKGAGFMKSDRSTNYESMYQITSTIFTAYVFLISLPTSSAVQNLLHYNLPSWITQAGSIGMVFFSVMQVVSYFSMVHEKEKRKKESREKFQWKLHQYKQHSRKFISD